MKLLKKKDLFMIVDHAKSQNFRLPARVVIEGKELGPTDRMALAYFFAVCQVLGENGIDTTGLQVQYDEDQSYASLSEFESRYAGSSENPPAKSKK